jgi:hypothetical protein
MQATSPAHLILLIDLPYNICDGYNWREIEGHLELL